MQTLGTADLLHRAAGIRRTLPAVARGASTDRGTRRPAAPPHDDTRRTFGRHAAERHRPRLLRRAAAAGAAPRRAGATRCHHLREHVQPQPVQQPGCTARRALRSAGLVHGPQGRVLRRPARSAVGFVLGLVVGVDGVIAADRSALGNSATELEQSPRDRRLCADRPRSAISWDPCSPARSG